MLQIYVQKTIKKFNFIESKSNKLEWESTKSLIKSLLQEEYIDFIVCDLKEYIIYNPKDEKNLKQKDKKWIISLQNKKTNKVINKNIIIKKLENKIEIKMIS